MALDYKSGLARYRRYLQVAAERPPWKASAVLIFSLVLVIVLLITALRPTLITISSLLGQISGQRDVADRMNEKIVAVQQAAGLLDNYRDKIFWIDEALPERPEWLAWARELETTASESGLLLQSATVGPVQISGNGPVKKTGVQKSSKSDGSTQVLPPGVTSVEFRLTASGDYQQVKTYIDLLERKKRLALISNIQLGKEKDGGLTVVLEGIIGYSGNITEN